MVHDVTLESSKQALPSAGIHKPSQQHAHATAESNTNFGIEDKAVGCPAAAAVGSDLSDHKVCGSKGSEDKVCGSKADDGRGKQEYADCYQQEYADSHLSAAHARAQPSAYASIRQHSAPVAGSAAAHEAADREQMQAQSKEIQSQLPGSLSVIALQQHVEEKRLQEEDEEEEEEKLGGEFESQGMGQGDDEGAMNKTTRTTKNETTRTPVTQDQSGVTVVNEVLTVSGVT